jgi:hypothetical protein
MIVTSLLRDGGGMQAEYCLFASVPARNRNFEKIDFSEVDKDRQNELGVELISRYTAMVLRHDLGRNLVIRESFQ